MLKESDNLGFTDACDSLSMLVLGYKIGVIDHPVISAEMIADLIVRMTPVHLSLEFGTEKHLEKCSAELVRNVLGI